MRTLPPFRSVGVLVLTALGAGCAHRTPPATLPEPAVLANHAVVDVIAFGSCLRGDEDPAVWDAILSQDPDLFLFIGDNVYVDVPVAPRGPADYAAKYDELATHPGWRALKAAVPVLATWDDHDYGRNDAGAEFALKRIAQRQFLDFFAGQVDTEVDAEDGAARRDRSGIYHAQTFGPAGQRVQVILLDTRFHRGPLTRNEHRPRGRGPYRPDAESTSGLLGDAQWTWLEQQLRRPADLRVIASSIQVVADEHGYETWGNLPRERDRLYRLIDDTHAAGVVFISGDRHLLELSREAGPEVPYPLWDITSSGLDTRRQAVSEPNRARVGPVFRGINFGVLRIDWTADRPALTLEGRGQEGNVITSAVVPLDTLRGR